VSVYECNLASLSKRDCRLTEFLLSIPPGNLPHVRETFRSEEIEVQDSKHSFRFIENFGANIEFEISEHTRLIILFGFGLGSEFLSLWNGIKHRKHCPEILIIEPDASLFSMALHMSDMSELFNNPRIHFWIGIEKDEIPKALTQFFVRTGRAYLTHAIQIISHRSIFKIYEDYFKYVEARANEILFFASHLYGTSCEDGLNGFKNFLNNIKLLESSPTLSDLENVFQAKPAIVIASGPSLDAALPILRECQERALLIACDSALKPLLNAGIRPHFVTAIERDPIVPQFFALENDSLDDIALIACPVVLPEAMKPFQERVILALRDYDYFELACSKEKLMALGPTCGNLAFQAARNLGCSPIVLIGQDLAYSAEDFRSHVRGTICEERDKPNEPNHLIDRGFFKVAGNFGKPVLTEVGLYLALLSYEKALRDFPVRCINTGTGAHIQGTESKTLADCLREDLSVSYPHIRDQVLGYIRPKNKKIEGDQAGKDWPQKRTVLLQELEGILAKNRMYIRELEKTRASPPQSVREAVIRAEAWCVELQNENQIFQQVFGVILAPFLHESEKKLRRHFLDLGSGQAFFRFCLNHYGKFLQELSQWTERVHSEIEKSGP